MSENLSYLSGRPSKGVRENLFEKLSEAAFINEGTPEDKELKKLNKN